ncbi:MAG: hypothetical protein AAGC54_19665 [Cyanobacteria bacterium P01_F01_bin.4]
MAKLPENSRPPGRSSLRSPRLPALGEDAVSLRHEVNPAIALNLLGEIHQKVANAQQDLRGLVLKIQQIYAEGPVVNGWLESTQSNPSAPPADANSALFRHADVDDLMTYIHSLDSAQATEPRHADPQYRLCMIDQMGNVQSRPCPPEQVPAVSIAIARHQKLHHIITRKQHLEQQLKAVVSALTEINTQLGKG